MELADLRKGLGLLTLRPLPNLYGRDHPGCSSSHDESILPFLTYY